MVVALLGPANLKEGEEGGSRREGEEGGGVRREGEGRGRRKGERRVGVGKKKGRRFKGGREVW